MTVDLLSRYAPPDYHGESQEHADELRAITQRIEALMTDCSWRTAHEIRTTLGLGPETDVLRRLRELRQARENGARWAVERRVRHGRTWEYRIQPYRSELVDAPQSRGTNKTAEEDNE